MPRDTRSRIAELERRRPRTVQGYRTTVMRADGRSERDGVFRIHSEPHGEPERFASVDAFHAKYPHGEITRHLILEYTPKPPAPWSLAAQLFGSEA